MVQTEMKPVADGASENTEAEEPNEPVTVCLGDTQALKTALDDSMAQMILERGFPEDHSISNVKIALGLLASAFGLFGQFHEYIGFAKFPYDRHILGLCVGGYMVCSMLLSVHAILWEKNFIVACKGEADAANTWPQESEVPAWCKDIVAVKVETKLERFSDEFVVGYHLQTSGGTWHDVEEHTQSICKWFDAEGLFLEEKFQKWSKEMLQKSAKNIQRK